VQHVGCSRAHSARRSMVYEELRADSPTRTRPATAVSRGRGGVNYAPASNAGYGQPYAPSPIAASRYEEGGMVIGGSLIALRYLSNAGPSG